MNKDKHNVKDTGRNKEIRNFQPSDYEKTDEQAKGLSVTHEQVSDTFTEGTIDGKLDKVDADGNLISHEGEEIPREGYKK